MTKEEIIKEAFWSGWKAGSKVMRDLVVSDLPEEESKEIALNAGSQELFKTLEKLEGVENDL